MAPSTAKQRINSLTLHISGTAVLTLLSALTARSICSLTAILCYRQCSAYADYCELV